MSILTINNLTKTYGKITAVNDLSLTIEKGNIYGILGPNGSGKTTTLGIILGIIHADSGSFEWFEGKYGSNPRRNMGALLETPNFYPYLNAIENLQIVAHIKRVKNPRIHELLGLVNLAERDKSKFKTYSLGMKQRLAIAAAMIGDPEVLIFDEPTNGLDPQGIAEVRETIIDIAADGRTILMASHILDEVEKTCSHVAIIKKGNLMATGTVGAILSDDIIIEIGAESMDELQNLLVGLPQINKLETEDNHFTLQAEKELSTSKLNQLAFQKGITLTHLVAKQKSLESEFLEITK
jgi:ABC-2 type transport system ATP-binding protein